MPAQRPPATIATTIVSEDVERAGQPGLTGEDGAPANAATRYWPSTPMLNRFIRKPTATAMADR